MKYYDANGMEILDTLIIQKEYFKDLEVDDKLLSYFRNKYDRRILKSLLGNSFYNHFITYFDYKENPEKYIERTRFGTIINERCPLIKGMLRKIEMTLISYTILSRNSDKEFLDMISIPERSEVIDIIKKEIFDTIDTGNQLLKVIITGMENITSYKTKYKEYKKLYKNDKEKLLSILSNGEVERLSFLNEDEGVLEFPLNYEKMINGRYQNIFKTDEKLISSFIGRYQFYIDKIDRIGEDYIFSILHSKYDGIVKRLRAFNNLLKVYGYEKCTVSESIFNSWLKEFSKKFNPSNFVERLKQEPIEPIDGANEPSTDKLYPYIEIDLRKINPCFNGSFSEDKDEIERTIRLARY